MTLAGEMRVVRSIVVVIAAAIAFTVGPIAAFGGLDGMSALMFADAPAHVDPALRNHLRAITAAFAGFGILGAWSVWSLAALEARKVPFRIACGTIFAAGLARVTGWVVDGYPGVLAVIFIAVELIVFPAVFLWHARLLRLQAAT